jgi:hypothetical protein
VPADVERLTFADLQERRRTILERMGEKAPARGGRIVRRRAPGPERPGP